MEVLYTANRPELLRFFQARDRSVLDVGCGAGGLAPALRAAGANRIVGVEADAAHAAAASRTCDHVVQSSIEDALRLSTLGPERFDLILLADVLEHLVDPWAVLRGLVDDHLASAGEVFISLPNVAHVSVLKQLLLRREWRYEQSGMFDRTHLRWFGAGNLRALIHDSGLEVAQWGGRVSFQLGPFRYARLHDDVSRVPRAAIYSFCVLARRDEGPR